MTKYTAMLIRKMPAQMHRRLRAEAKRKDTTMSKIVLLALSAYMDTKDTPIQEADK